MDAETPNSLLQLPWLTHLFEEVGIMDERGVTRFVEPKKVTILVSGFSAFQSEQEKLISLCPAVLACTMIGMEDAKQGKVLEVFAVRTDPTLNEQNASRSRHTEYAAYRYPKRMKLRNDLTLWKVGKILRRSLHAPP